MLHQVIWAILCFIASAKWTFPLRQITPEVATTLPNAPGDVAIHHASSRLFLAFHHIAFATLKPDEGMVNEYIWAERKLVPYPKVSANYSIGDKHFGLNVKLAIDQIHGWLFIVQSSCVVGISITVVELETDEIVKEYRVSEDTFGSCPTIQTVVADRKGRYLFLADSGVLSMTPSIAVLDTHIWRVWKVLNNHASILGKKSTITVNGHVVEQGGIQGVSALAIDSSGENLIFGTMLGESLFSVPIKHITKQPKKSRRSTRVNEDVEVKSFGPKSATNGMIMVRDQLYLTDFEHSEIVLSTRAQPNQRRELATFMKSEELFRWPQGIATDQSFLYVTASCYHLAAESKDFSRWAAPFHLLRIPLYNKIQQDEL